MLCVAVRHSRSQYLGCVTAPRDDTDEQLSAPTVALFVPQLRVPPTVVPPRDAVPVWVSTGPQRTGPVLMLEQLSDPPRPAEPEVDSVVAESAPSVAPPATM